MSDQLTEENISFSEYSFASIDPDGSINHTVNYCSRYIEYGDDDDYPRKLNWLAKECPLHGSLIKSIAQMIAGRGVDGDVDKINIVNSDGEDIDYILIETAEELKKNGYTYLEVIKAKSKNIINVIPARFVRHAPHPPNRKPDTFLVMRIPDTYSDDDEFDESHAIEVKAFDGERNKSILYIRTADTTTVSYAAPDYEGAIKSLMLDMSARNHKINSVSNGFLPSALINFRNGVPTKEKRKAIEDKFIEKYTGSNGRSRVLFSWNNPGQETTTTIDTFEPPNIAKFFKDLTPEVQQEILNAHRVTSPLLFGVRAGQGGLGSNKDEMIQAYDIFSETVINPYQKILNKSFNKIYKFFGIEQDFKINPMIPKALQVSNEQEGGQPADNIQDTADRVVNGVKKGGPKDKNPINQINKANTKEDFKYQDLEALTMLDKVINFFKTLRK